jgi:hypothetical protein
MPVALIVGQTEKQAMTNALYVSKNTPEWRVAELAAKLFVFG